MSRALLQMEEGRLLDLADHIISELDQLQGDPDFEPSLGSLGGAGRAAEQADQRGWSTGGRRDLEEQCEGEGDNPYDELCRWPDEGDQTAFWRKGRF